MPIEHRNELAPLINAAILGLAGIAGHFTSKRFGKKSKALRIFILVVTTSFYAWLAIVIKSQLSFQDERKLVQNRNVEAAARIDDIDKDPEVGFMFASFKKQFPEEYSAIMERLKDSIRVGKPNHEISALMRSNIKSFTQPRLKYAAAAPDEVLVKMLGSTVALIGQFQKDDVRVCAIYAHKDMAGLEGQQLSKPAMKLMMQLFVDQITAIREGMDHPVSRPPVTVELAESVFKRMEGLGVSMQRVDSFFSSENPESLPVGEACEITLSFYKAMKTLPLKDAAWMYTMALNENP